MPDIKLITENLADELIPSIQKASVIYILTSFVMASVFVEIPVNNYGRMRKENPKFERSMRT